MLKFSLEIQYQLLGGRYLLKRSNVLLLWGYSSVLRASLKCMVFWIICYIISSAVNVPCPNFTVVDLFFYLFPLVTVDYKTLILFLAKIGNLEFQPGGPGVVWNFGFICNAIRVSIHVFKGQMNQKSDIFCFSSLLVKCVQDDLNKHTIKFQLNWSKCLRDIRN